MTGWPALHEIGKSQLQNGCSSGREFTIEKVRAVRAFDVDEHGRLRSPSFDSGFIFRPGENEARCNRGGRHGLRGGFSSCTCGFYVWHRPAKADEYRDCDNGVVAVVDVYGKVDVGVDGARAEKLEVVAIDAAGPRLLRAVDKIDRFLPWGWISLLMLAASIASGIASVTTAGERPSSWHVIWLVGSIVMTFVSGIFFVAGCAEFGSGFFRREPPNPDDARLAKLRANYPDVTFVRSRKELLERFPVTGPQRIERTPETDPNFWDRP